MIETERNKKKTDRAWNALYQRLEEEGLLSGRPASPFRSILWKGGMAAAVALLCLLVSVVYLNRTEREADRNLLTRQNSETTTTLVTTLEDGSVVYLAENTSLQYPQHFSSDRREVSLQGNALFDVAGNRARPFVIETEDTRIEVLGTAFNVKSSGSSPFELSVQRGEVKVTLKKSGQDIHVKAGETVTLLSRKLQLSATPDPGQFARYTERIRFKDEMLGNILRVINSQNPGIRLETTPELQNRTLTVTFSNDTPEDMAELICLALNLKKTEKNNTITLSE
ncbi:FecR domain-containing protein [Parabacteroides sp. AF17-28]|uniref:FecR family protein n=1 Tax=Parabacteroides sp. AF17-28 TaxID=2292241 RepID=UPI000EFDCA44|nr:FecR domain-containing protein [Parabacteroides sp. AF17-28]RHR61747.1 anti-sigma factor [Parabacteroides sp. AF17-28]